MDNFDKNNALTVLGIETTCDETAASVVSLDKNGISKLHSNIIHSQYEEHSEFGGIVPEVAARSHLNNISFIVAKAIENSKNEINKAIQIVAKSL